MSPETIPSQADIDRLFVQLTNEAKSAGYFLNPDVDFTKSLVKGLLLNEARYSYQACPCRLADGIKTEDMDIICPCDYRDADLGAFDTCY
jgi:ferredoxin-thioredoxin reductase catalytic subunit